MPFRLPEAPHARGDPLSTTFGDTKGEDLPEDRYLPKFAVLATRL